MCNLFASIGIKSALYGFFLDYFRCPSLGGAWSGIGECFFVKTQWLLFREAGKPVTNFLLVKA
jgi:hypothetical protein